MTLGRSATRIPWLLGGIKNALLEQKQTKNERPRVCVLSTFGTRGYKNWNSVPFRPTKGLNERLYQSYQDRAVDGNFLTTGEGYVPPALLSMRQIPVLRLIPRDTRKALTRLVRTRGFASKTSNIFSNEFRGVSIQLRFTVPRVGYSRNLSMAGTYRR